MVPDGAFTEGGSLGDKGLARKTALPALVHMETEHAQHQPRGSIAGTVLAAHQVEPLEFFKLPSVHVHR
jgi:hypothetical protein